MVTTLSPASSSFRYRLENQKTELSEIKQALEFITLLKELYDSTEASRL